MRTNDSPTPKSDLPGQQRTELADAQQLNHLAGTSLTSMLPLYHIPLYYTLLYIYILFYIILFHIVSCYIFVLYFVLL